MSQLIIAIGRESGSGGLEIARTLAERFGLPLYDKSILQSAAEDRGVDPKSLEQYDERPRSPLFYRSIKGFSSAPEDGVAQMQFDLLRRHAAAGESFVVLGRCAKRFWRIVKDWCPSSSRPIWTSASGGRPCRETKRWNLSADRIASAASIMTSTAKTTGATPRATIWSSTAPGWAYPARQTCWNITSAPVRRIWTASRPVWCKGGADVRTTGREKNVGRTGSVFSPGTG